MKTKTINTLPHTSMVYQIYDALFFSSALVFIIFFPIFAIYNHPTLNIKQHGEHIK